jgi:hypothetical protein
VQKYLSTLDFADVGRLNKTAQSQPRLLPKSQHRALFATIKNKILFLEFST